MFLYNIIMSWEIGIVVGMFTFFLLDFFLCVFFSVFLFHAHLLTFHYLCSFQNLFPFAPEEKETLKVDKYNQGAAKLIFNSHCIRKQIQNRCFVQITVFLLHSFCLFGVM